MNSLINLRNLFIISLLVFISSCGKEWRGVKGEGPIVTEQRNEGNFSGVEFNLSGKVFIHKDSICRVVVRTYVNYQPLVHTHVSGGRLMIDSYKSLHDDEVYIDVYMPDADHISVNGSGSVTSTDIFTSPSTTLIMSGSGQLQFTGNVNLLKANISGSGFIYIFGTADDARLTVSGSGRIKAFGLLVADEIATISGSGRIETNVSSTLQVTISGSGSLYYRGNPQLNTTITGSGKIYRS